MNTQLQYLLLQSEFKYASKKQIIIIVPERCALEHSLLPFHIFSQALGNRPHGKSSLLRRLAEIKSEASVDFWQDLVYYVRNTRKVFFPSCNL